MFNWQTVFEYHCCITESWSGIKNIQDHDGYHLTYRMDNPMGDLQLPHLDFVEVFLPPENEGKNYMSFNLMFK